MAKKKCIECGKMFEQPDIKGFYTNVCAKCFAKGADEIDRAMEERKKKMKRPLWKIKKEMKDLESELEMLKKDPATSREEIEEAEDRLTSLRTEYKERVAELEGKSVPF